MNDAPVLICAATRWEAGPLSARLGLSPRPGGAFFEGSSGARRIILARTGMGPANVARRLAQLDALAGGPPRLRCVLSAGLAGSLRPDVRSGEIVADLDGGSAAWTQAARSAASACGLRLHLARIAHADQVLAPEGKAALAGIGASAVDMESEPARRWARDRGLPAFALRIILDEAQETLPTPPSDPDEPSSLVGYALRDPLQIGSLVSWGWRTRRRIAALGRFLEAFLAQERGGDEGR